MYLRDVFTSTYNRARAHTHTHTSVTCMPRGHRPQDRYISVRWTREQLAARRAFSIILFIFQHAQAEPDEYRQDETLKLAPAEKASKLWDIALQTPRTVHGNFAQTDPGIRLFPRNLCLSVIYRITIDSRTLGKLFDCFLKKKREKKLCELLKIYWTVLNCMKMLNKICLSSHMDRFEFFVVFDFASKNFYFCSICFYLNIY